MNRYRYKAVSPSGEIFEGELEAKTQALVISNIQADGKIPISTELVKEKISRSRRFFNIFHGKKLGNNDVIELTRELSILLKAGLPLEKALGLLKTYSVNEPRNKLIADLKADLRSGQSFSSALEKHENLFSKFYINAVEVSESSGTMESCMCTLANHYEKIKKIKDSLMSSLIYPFVLTIVTLASLVIILTYVVPQFSELFAESMDLLPWSTQFVILVSSFISKYWMALMVLFLISLIGFMSLIKQESVRYKFDEILITLPVIGDVLKRIEMTHFSRSLATLLKNGVSLTKGLEIITRSLNNKFVSRQVKIASAAVKRGEGLADSLKSSSVFPVRGINLIRVGEESGSVDDMLFKVSDLYEQEIESSLKRALTLVEPIIIVTMGVVIAFIVMSILLALVSVNDLPM